MLQMMIFLIIFCIWIAIVIDPVRNDLVVNEVSSLPLSYVTVKDPE